MKKGEVYNIHGYKHNGKLYKTWDEAVLLDETEDYYVFGNNNTKVSKIFGKSWYTKETAILFYFKNNWYNIIAQLKKKGIYYYCNIASPVIIEDKTIKFIDYDLDLRVFPDSSYKVLDRSEYEYHKKKMGYSDDLDKVINNGLRELINEYKNKSIIFNEEKNNNYLKLYMELKKIEQNSNFS